MQSPHRFWPHTRLNWLLLAVFLAVAVGAALGGFLLFRAQAAATNTTESHTLESIAALKVKQISDWRNERLYDATILATSALFRDGFDAWSCRAKSRAGSGLAHLAAVYLPRGSLLEYRPRRCPGPAAPGCLTGPGL